MTNNNNVILSINAALADLKHLTEKLQNEELKNQLKKMHDTMKKELSIHEKNPCKAVLSFEEIEKITKAYRDAVNGILSNANKEEKAQLFKECQQIMEELAKKEQCKEDKEKSARQGEIQAMLIGVFFAIGIPLEIVFTKISEVARACYDFGSLVIGLPVELAIDGLKSLFKPRSPFAEKGLTTFSNNILASVQNEELQRENSFKLANSK